MENNKIPEVFPICEGQFVTVPTKSWNTMVEAVNKLSKLTAEQSRQIESLNKLGIQQSENISKISAILEVVYENIE